MGDIAIIDHNPRGGEKIDFYPAQETKIRRKRVSGEGQWRTKRGIWCTPLKSKRSRQSHVKFYFWSGCTNGRSDIQTCNLDEGILQVAS